MSDFLQSLTEYTASLEQRLSALESALSVLQTQWAVAQTKEKEQEAIIASLAAKNSMLQSCISAQEERIAALEKPFADGEWVEIPEEIPAEAVEEPIAEEPIAEEPIVEEPIVEEPIAEEPIAEEPIVEEPVAEEPIVDEEKVVAEETVAPKANLYGKPVDDIKQAIALGDRFLFQRELFRQNVELMQRTFADINALHSFNEAIAYLDKHFDWDKESNTYALFLTALHRRFS
ncbi:MAG: hypothetical protein SPE88_03930 [Paludibacteraceae bacterium]|nr:hypothetical protein [Paludibacteraceae bacterium]